MYSLSVKTTVRQIGEVCTVASLSLVAIADKIDALAPIVWLMTEASFLLLPITGRKYIPRPFNKSYKPLKHDSL